ncbi:MAG: type II secretion system F family protein [Comamonas sp.]
MANGLALGFAALALLLLAGGVFLLGKSRQQVRQRETVARIDRGVQSTLSGSGTSGLLGLSAYDPAAHARGSGSDVAAWRRWILERRGGALWDISARVIGVVLLVIAGAVALGGWTAGGFGLVFGLLLGLGVTTLALWRRAQKKRQRILSQLPGFLDNMVRLISIGNSPHAAFQLALANLEPPIKACLDQAGSMLRAGKDLDHAVSQSAHSHDVNELDLVAAVLRMSVRYGGRADVVLARVADYIRDLQSAEQELHALSAETRLSAWILALLPIGVGALIIFLNGRYFQHMWQDSTGRHLILAAGVLEAVGAFVLYRLARLK